MLVKRERIEFFDFFFEEINLKLIMGFKRDFKVGIVFLMLLFGLILRKSENDFWNVLYNFMLLICYFFL